MLFLRLFRILWGELSARPILAFTVASLTVTTLVAYSEERDRLNAIVRDTIHDLNDRSEEIEARIARAAAEEMDAEFDADRWLNDGEIARRLGIAR